MEMAVGSGCAESAEAVSGVSEEAPVFSGALSGTDSEAVSDVDSEADAICSEAVSDAAGSAGADGVQPERRSKRAAEAAVSLKGFIGGILRFGCGFIKRGVLGQRGWKEFMPNFSASSG